VAKVTDTSSANGSVLEPGGSNPPGRKPNRDQLYPDQTMQGLRIDKCRADTLVRLVALEV